MSQISWTIVWIIVGLFLNSQCNKNICYEKRIDNYLFYLVFCTYVAQTVPEKEIDFEGSFIMDDARSASLPIEAYLQDTQVVITFYVDLSDATVTIASEENNQEMEERTISFIDSAPEVFNISGYSKGTYIITITTPRGTYLSGLFRIE